MRVVTSDDEGELAALFEHLSPSSRRLRFLGAKPHLSERELHYLSEVDGDRHLALVFEARVGASGHWHAVGVARCVRLEPMGPKAEVAVAIEDEWQHRGIGTELIGRLAEWARQVGVRTWVAVIDANNTSMRRLIEGLAPGPPRVRIAGPGVLELEQDLVSEGRARMNDATSIRQEFMADHARLEASLRDLTNAAEGASPDELIAVWRGFEAGLRAHLEVEEASMFPLIRDAELLGQLRDDHDEIRRSLDELGLAVELHSIREERVDRFVEHLRAHAAREDEWLYGLADAALDEAGKQTLLQRLADLVHRRSTR